MCVCVSSTLNTQISNKYLANRQDVNVFLMVEIFFYEWEGWGEVGSTYVPVETHVTTL